MARTIEEIKQEIVQHWMADERVRERYNLREGATFEESYTKVSVESLLFYTVAFGVWVLEKLMDRHREEVEAMLAAKLPHTARWYRDQVLAFKPEWAEEEPVKYCAVDDGDYRLTIKVAGGEPGRREPVGAEEEQALKSWLSQAKDAGVRVTVVNEAASRLRLTLRVWYDPLEMRPGDRKVEQRMREYVSTLDFDGLLSRNGIVEEAKREGGVKLVRIESLETADREESYREFGEQERSVAGYWTFASEGELSVIYEPYSRGTI